MSRSSEALPIEPRGALDTTVRVPGSKSITNRAFLAAALGDGRSTLEGALASDDTRYMREALEALGVRIEQPGVDDAGGTGTADGGAGKSEATEWTVHGTGGRLRHPDQTLYVGLAGTAMRFLTAACTLADGPVLLDGNARMRERPIDDLARALSALGARVELRGQNGCPPVALAGGGIAGGSATIEARRSSQFVSAVLLAAPYAQRDVQLRFEDDALASRPYVDLTLQVMQAFGADAAWRDDQRSLWVRAGRTYQPRRYAIEPDASSAVYPLCAAAIAGGRVRVEGIPPDSLQPDLALVAILERMGCTVVRGESFLELQGPAEGLQSLGSVDMNRLPDAAIAYAVVALFAKGKTRIENVANLRIKETDRLAALETELRRLGARASTGPDWIEIQPGPLHGAAIETYDDHRMAMAFALAGLRVPGVSIVEPGCVSKSWPKYFEDFEQL